MNIKDKAWFEPAMVILGVVCVILVAVAVAIAVKKYNLAHTPHTTIELRSDEWHCTKTQTTTSTVPLFANNTLLMRTVHNETCVTYQRNDNQ